MSRMKDFVLRDIEGGGNGQWIDSRPLAERAERMNRNTAQLFDYTSRLIAHCANAPEAIAKAAMEHPEVRFYQAWGTGGMRHIGAVTQHMHDRNQAASHYVAVAGVIAAVDTFDPAEVIDN